PRQRHADAGDTDLSVLHDAVVVGVNVDRAGQRRRQQLAEVVVLTAYPRPQIDVVEGVVDRGAGARRPLRVLAVDVPGRLRLGDSRWRREAVADLHNAVRSYAEGIAGFAVVVPGVLLRQIQAGVWSDLHEIASEAAAGEDRLRWRNSVVIAGKVESCQRSV